MDGAEKEAGGAGTRNAKFGVKGSLYKTGDTAANVPGRDDSRGAGRLISGPGVMQDVSVVDPVQRGLGKKVWKGGVACMGICLGGAR